MVAPTREALKRAGLPYVIENVVGAPLISPVLLCGSMFRLETHPYPDGWRAQVSRPEVLPDYPVVSMRGGFPDGS